MPDFRPDLHPRDRKGRWRDIANVRALRPGEGHRLPNGIHVSRGSGAASDAFFVSPYGHARGVSGGRERVASPEAAVRRAHELKPLSPGRPVGGTAPGGLARGQAVKLSTGEHGTVVGAHTIAHAPKEEAYRVRTLSGETVQLRRHLTPQSPGRPRFTSDEIDALGGYPYKTAGMNSAWHEGLMAARDGRDPKFNVMSTQRQKAYERGYKDFKKKNAKSPGRPDGVLPAADALSFSIARKVPHGADREAIQRVVDRETPSLNAATRRAIGDKVAGRLSGLTKPGVGIDRSELGRLPQSPGRPTFTQAEWDNRGAAYSAINRRIEQASTPAEKERALEDLRAHMRKFSIGPQPVRFDPYSGGVARSPGRPPNEKTPTLTPKEFRTVAEHSANPYIESADSMAQGRRLEMPAANLAATRDDIANTLSFGTDQFGLPIDDAERPHLESAMKKMTAELQRRGAETAQSPGRPLAPNEREAYRDYGTPASRDVFDRVLRAHPEAKLAADNAAIATIHTPIGDLEVSQETGGTWPPGLAHALDPSFPTAGEQTARSPGRPDREQAGRYIADLESGGRGLDSAGWLTRIGWLRDHGYYNVPLGAPPGPWTDHLTTEGRELALAATPGIARSPGRPTRHNASLGTEYREAEHDYREAQHTGGNVQRARERLDRARQAIDISMRRNAMAHSPGRPAVPEPAGGVSLRVGSQVAGPYATWDQAAHALANVYRDTPGVKVEAHGHSAKSAAHSILNAREQEELVRRTARLLTGVTEAVALTPPVVLTEAWTEEARKAALEARRRGGHAAVVDLVRRGDQPAQRVAHAISDRDARGLLKHLDKEDPADPHVRALKKSLRARLAPKGDPVPDMQMYLSSVVAQYRTAHAAHA